MINVIIELSKASDFGCDLYFKGHSEDKLVCCAVSTIVEHYHTLANIVEFGKIEYNELQEELIKIYVPLECMLAVKAQLKGIKREYNADINIKVI